MPTLQSADPVLDVAPASSDAVLAHFEALLQFETDCSDVHASLSATSAPSFVLVDVRSPALFAAGHIGGAVNIPHARLTPRNLDAYAPDTVFVVYCGGPHCNGADKAAIRLARLGRPVKKMIGGIEGWKDEGFTLMS